MNDIYLNDNYSRLLEFGLKQNMDLDPSKKKSFNKNARYTRKVAYNINGSNIH